MATHFPDSEFQAASSRILTAGDRLNAASFRALLDPVRDVLGPIRITSFARGINPDTGRTEQGAHAYGWGLDLVPTAVTVRALADMLAARYLSGSGGNGALAQVIDERTHVHAALRLVAGATGGYLSEPTEGRYVTTSPDPAKISPQDYRLVLGGAAVLAAMVLLS